MLTKDNNDLPTFQSNKAMDKAQEIANKILRTTPHLVKQLPSDSIFRGQNQTAPTQITNTVQMPAIKRPEIKESKKKGSTMASAPQITTASNFKVFTKPDGSVIDWQERYTDLDIKYKELKEEMRALQHDKEEKEQRYVKREAGYRKLIDELHEELRRDFSLNGEERKAMENIAGLHTKIMSNINDMQLKTSKVLLDQEKDIIRFFNNKINEIKKQFEEERIRRGKKDQSYEVKEKQLIAELEWIKDIAQKIDQENHTLMKKYMDLKAQYSTQENDREILLREVILKKKKNAILKSQIEQYEKILEDVAKDKDGSSLMQEFPEKSVDRLSQTMKGEGGMFGLNQVESKRKSELYSSLQKERAPTTMSTQMRTDGIINKLKTALQREKRKVQQLKTLYIKELESKSNLEKVLRSCIEDIKDDIFAAQKERSSNKKSTPQNEILEKRERSNLVEKLINDERILTLIYDKTFYASNKKIEIPPELLRDDDEDEENLDEVE